jgi:hypothetical protein
VASAQCRVGVNFPRVECRRAGFNNRSVIEDIRPHRLLSGAAVRVTGDFAFNLAPGLTSSTSTSDSLLESARVLDWALIYKFGSTLVDAFGAGSPRSCPPRVSCTKFSGHESTPLWPRLSAAWE